MTDRSEPHRRRPRTSAVAINGRLDRNHFLKVSKEAKIIKLLDRIDNVRDMGGADDGFKGVYLDETLMLGAVLLEIDRDITPLYIELITELNSLL